MKDANGNSVYPRGVDGAKVMQVIETVSCRGRGTEEQMSRPIRQYWSLDGELLAECDPVTTLDERLVGA